MSGEPRCNRCNCEIGLVQFWTNIDGAFCESCWKRMSIQSQAPDVVELKSSEAFKRYIASHRALIEELAAELGIPASVLESRGTR